MRTHFANSKQEKNKVKTLLKPIEANYIRGDKNE